MVECVLIVGRRAAPGILLQNVAELIEDPITIPEYQSGAGADAALQCHFHNLENAESVLAKMDAGVEAAKGRASVVRDMSRVDGRPNWNAFPTCVRKSTSRLRRSAPCSRWECGSMVPMKRMRFQVPPTPSLAKPYR